MSRKYRAWLLAIGGMFALAPSALLSVWIISLSGAAALTQGIFWIPTLGAVGGAMLVGAFWVRADSLTTRVMLTNKMLVGAFWVRADRSSLLGPRDSLREPEDDKQKMSF